MQKVLEDLVYYYYLKLCVSSKRLLGPTPFLALTGTMIIYFHPNLVFLTHS